MIAQAPKPLSSARAISRDASEYSTSTPGSSGSGNAVLTASGTPRRGTSRRSMPLHHSSSRRAPLPRN
eukprot:5395366-Prymnesium_polylepis.1